MSIVYNNSVSMYNNSEVNNQIESIKENKTQTNICETNQIVYQYIAIWSNYNMANFYQNIYICRDPLTYSWSVF